MDDTASPQLNFHCRMMAALIHDCVRFFDPPTPTVDDAADWMVSCTIQHSDLFRLPNSESEPSYFTDSATSHYISLPFDQLQPGNNSDVWNGAVDEEWKLHIINLVILRDILSVHPSSERIIFQDLKPLFIRIIEDLRQELHVFLHTNDSGGDSTHIRNLRDVLGRLFPYDSSRRFQRALLHTYRFPDEFLELRRLADVPASDVPPRDHVDETRCQCQAHRCLLLDMAHALLEWVRDGADSYGRAGREVRGPTSATFTNPFTRKLLVARDLSCGLVNGGERFTLTYRTVIEHYVDSGGELSSNDLDIWHQFEGDTRTTFLATVENIRTANRNEDVDALSRELESVFNILGQLSGVCPNDVPVTSAAEEQGDVDVPPVDNSFPHDAPNFNAPVNPPSDSESDDDATEHTIFRHARHNDAVPDIHGLLKNTYMRGRRRRIAGINWDMRFPPTRRHAHYSDNIQPALQDVWHESAFNLPPTYPIIELKSDHPSFGHLLERIPLRISTDNLTVEDVLYALYDYLQTHLTREEEQYWTHTPGNAPKMTDMARERAHVVARQPRWRGEELGGGDHFRRLDLLNRRHWFDGLRLENRGGVVQVFVDVSRV